MIKLKPANIFHFWAPTGGGSKIADYKGNQSPPITIETPPIDSGTYQIDCTPNMTGEYVVSAKKINWGNWILGGIYLLGATGLIIWYHSDEQKKKRRDKDGYW
jgi:hypothetical protein